MRLFNHKNENHDKGHNPMKHMLHMIICCGLPVLIIFSLPFIASISPSLAGILGIISPFLCPVMMIGMMIMMMRSNKPSCCDEKKAPTDN